MFKCATSYIFLGLLTLSLWGCGGSSYVNGSDSVDESMRLESIEVTFSGAGIDDNSATSLEPSSLGPHNFSVSEEVHTANIRLEGQFSKGSTVFAVYATETGTSVSREFEPSERIHFPLRAGGNSLIITLLNTEHEQSLTYQFVVVKAGNVDSAEAELTVVDFSGAVLSFTAEELGNPDVRIEREVDFSMCSLGVLLVATSSSTLLSFENTDSQSPERRLASSEIYYEPLSVGENNFKIKAISQDGTESRIYTLTVTRRTQQSPQTDPDYRLENLSLSEVSGEEVDVFGLNATYSGFRCDSFIYNAKVERSVETLRLAMNPSDVGRQVQVGRLSLNINGIPSLDPFALRYFIENPETVETGEAIELSLDAGSQNYYGVSLGRVQEGENSSDLIYAEYVITIERNERDSLVVKTGEEFQAALQNVLPNTEIILDPVNGQFTGSASEASSGKDGVVFFGSLSGADADSSVVIRGINGAVLSGAGSVDKTLLELEGGFWRVLNVNLQDAGIGVELNGVSDSIFGGVNIVNMADTALKLEADNHNNLFSDVTISNTHVSGLQGKGFGVVVGSPDGSLENTGNVFSSIIFGENVDGGMMHVYPGAVNTEVISSIFNTQNAPESIENAPVILGGNQIQFSFNTVSEDSDSAAAPIWLSDTIGAGGTEIWADDIRVYGNILSSAKAVPSPLMALGEGVHVVEAGDNKLVSGVSVEYPSAGVDTSYIPTAYLIESLGVEGQCLVRDQINLLDLDGSIISALDMIVLADCDNEQSDQLWHLSHIENGELYIESSVIPEESRKLLPLDRSRFSGSSVGSIVSTIQASESDSRALDLRWKLNRVTLDEIVIANRYDQRYVLDLGLLSADQFDTDKAALVLAPLSNSLNQRFKLVPISAP